jgi:hypothetical protein
VIQTGHEWTKANPGACPCLTDIEIENLKKVFRESRVERVEADQKGSGWIIRLIQRE